MTRYESMAAGAYWYDASRACRFGHLGRRRTSDRKCGECIWWEKKERAAVRRRTKRRKPTIADRRQSRFARRLRAKLPSDQLAMMEQAPDTIIDRRAAQAFGVSVYRLRVGCCGGWRFVVSGRCTVCGKLPTGGPIC